MGQVVDGRLADRLFELDGKRCSRHADMLREGLQGPVVRGIFVHGVDGSAHPSISQREEPFYAAAEPFRQMHPQCLD